MSVGQLLKMTANARRVAIRHLDPVSRMRLAHLASLGIRNQMERLAGYQQVLEALTGDDNETDMKEKK